MDADFKTVFFPLHQQANARIVPFAGYQMPVQYHSMIDEHFWTRQKAGLFDVAHMGRIHVTEDALEKIEKYIPADLQNLAPGKMVYSFWLNDKGGVVDDLIVTRLDHGAMIVSNASRKEIIFKNLQNLTTPNWSEWAALLALQGPRAAGVLADLGFDARDMEFMTAQEVTMKGTPVWLSRCGYTGEDGFEIALREEDALRFAEILLAQDDVKWAGLGARDSLRLEAGLCLYGQDLNEDITPVEAALLWAIPKARREEGGFRGAAILQKQIAEKPAQKRVGILSEARQPLRPGYELYNDKEEKIGILTSGGYSPLLEKGIGLGFAKTAFAATETVLYAKIREKMMPVRIVKLPFVPHHYYKK